MMPGKKKKYNARFPPARIKKIMQSDEEVGKVAAAVPVIISRALELFVENMLKKANEVTSRRGARTLTPSHLKYCINSESRFDFLKELVSGVPDLQGDMDINLDAIPTGSTGSELTTPPMITPVPSTTSSIAWPSEYSGLSSHTLPSNSTAIVTSPHNSPVAEASVSMVSQHYSKSSFKNNLNRNNNTSRSTGSYLKEETNPNALKDTNVPESKESLHTKGIRKRGRPRKSSTDASASVKPKKSKLSADDESLNSVQEIPSNNHATQYSLSYKPPPENAHTDLDVTLAHKIGVTKTNQDASLVKSKSLTETQVSEKLNFSRTYSTGCTTTSNDNSSTLNNSSIPSFTLTYPMIPSNTGPEIKSKKVNKTEKSSSHIEIQQPKLQNYSQGEKTNYGHESNNGFPFTITNILEKQLTMNKQTLSNKKLINGKDKSAAIVQTHNSIHKESEDNIQSLNCKTMSNSDKSNASNLPSEKNVMPTISWTMNVVAPKVNISEEIDEDYDA